MKYKMMTDRYMDEEERQVLVGILNGKWKTKSDLEKDTVTNGGCVMADFAILSGSGYCGWIGDRLVLTPMGEAAATASDPKDASS